MPVLKNPRHEEFARWTALGKTRAEAYKLAGYESKNPKTLGQALISRPEVRARVAEIERELTENTLAKAELDREWVLKNLKEQVETCRESIPVLDRSGTPTGVEKPKDASAANKSLELIGKELGMFADRLILDNLDSQLEGMSTTQLREFVASAASEVGLRVINMSDDQKREWIMKNAPRVGLRVMEMIDGGKADGDEAVGE